MLMSLGVEADLATLNIILPVGISFYTFQTLSYTIDIYRGKVKPTKDIIAFLAFVSLDRKSAHLMKQLTQYSEQTDALGQLFHQMCSCHPSTPPLSVAILDDRNAC